MDRAAYRRRPRSGRDGEKIRAGRGQERGRAVRGEEMIKTGEERGKEKG